MKDEAVIDEESSVRARNAEEPELFKNWLERKKMERARDRVEQKRRVEDMIRKIDFGKTLATLRRNANLSQAELAGMVGTNPSQIAKIESGLNTNPTMETAVGLIAPLGYTLTIVPIEQVG